MEEDGHNKNSDKPLDVFIEEHNRKRKKLGPIVVFIILAISLYLNFGMKLYSIAIGYLTYRFIKMIMSD